MHYYSYLWQSEYSQFEPAPLYLPLDIPEEPTTEEDEDENSGGCVIIIDMCPEE